MRNVAGLVPPYQPDGNAHGSSAALEYGVRVLKVKRIVVLGHARMWWCARDGRGARRLRRATSSSLGWRSPRRRSARCRRRPRPSRS
ncbi:MAG: carbonic anhydrase [Aliidongia sp.]